eukprot:EG_transcript_17419
MAGWKKRRLSLDLDAVQCPVCWDDITAPVFQCANGHLICAACHAALANCPSCRQRLTGCRNFAVERMLSAAAVPCAFQEHGCPEELPYGEKAAHEATCQHRLFPCPMPGIACGWTGKQHELAEHLRAKHQKKVEVLTSPGNRVSFDFLATDDCGTLRDGDRWLGFYEWQQHLFALTLHFRHGRFHCYVGGVGRELPGATYEVLLKAADYRLCWQAPVRSGAGEDVRLRTTECLVLWDDQIKLFAEKVGDRRGVAWRFHGTLTQPA